VRKRADLGVTEKKLSCPCLGSNKYINKSINKVNKYIIQWVPGDLSAGLRWPGRETNHSPPFSAEVKNIGAIPPLPHAPSRRNP
jgi:hypothetical protein